MTDTIIARYKHPQGATIAVYTNGAIVKTNPAGKVVSTSATAEKLAAGHGGWTLLGDGETTAPDVALPASKAAPSKVLLPMKFKEAALKDLPAYVVDDEWVLQQKLDGIRAQLVFEEGLVPWFRNGTGTVLASDTARAITNPILGGLLAPVPVGSGGYTVDGEVLDGAFWVFDLVDDLKRETFAERHLALQDWQARIAAGGFADKVKLLPTARTIDEKQKLVEAVYTQGAEGWIAKRLDGHYNWGSRVTHSLKIKVTHTVDVVVMERNRKREQNMVLGAYDNGALVEIGCASAIGKPNTVPGDVVEVKYLYAGANGRLVQPTVIRQRTDKPAETCTLDQLCFADKSVVTLEEKV